MEQPLVFSGRDDLDGGFIWTNHALKAHHWAFAFLPTIEDSLDCYANIILYLVCSFRLDFFERGTDVVSFAVFIERRIYLQIGWTTTVIFVTKRMLPDQLVNFESY